MRLNIIVFLVAGFPLVSRALFAADEPTLQPVTVIPLNGVQGRIDHMAMDEKAGRLYVAALGNNTVEVIDLAARKRMDTIKGIEEPQGIAVVPESQRVVIASGADDKCRIYDSSLRLVSQIDNLPDADNVRYDAKARQAIVGYGSGALAIIDPERGIKIKDIKLEGHPESFQLEKQGNRIFVNVPSAGQVAMVDRDKAEVIAKWAPAGAKSNFPMALDEANHRLFIGCRSPARLLVLDTETGRTLAALDCCGDTDDVFFDSTRKRLFVTGGEGFVSQFEQSDADHYVALAKVTTAAGARTSFYTPATGLLYVAVPHRGAQEAEIRIYGLTPAR